MDTSTADYIKQLENRVSALERLLEVNTVLNGALLSATPKIDALLSYIMDAAAKITDCEAASILLWRQNTQELFFAATTSDSESSRALIGKPVPLDSIAGTIFTERRTVQVDDALSDPRHYSKVDKDIQFVTRSLLGVPMISKLKVIGVLEVVNKLSLPWTKEDHHHLAILAEEAAVVIEVAQLVLALQKANQELNEVDKLKSDFIAIASHELRTPLGVILGYASFLQEEATTKEVGEHASKVMASALQLRHIIEDMVNLRYLKQNPSEMFYEQVNARDLLEEIRRESQAPIDAAGHTLVIDPPEEDIIVSIDRSRLTMAINNLMNNAIRFTPEPGIITVSAKLHNRRELWLSITDPGIGLEKKVLEKIFEEFYQVEDHMTRKHGGLGIGLSIARALIKAHGGRVWAESRGLGHGSTFICSLPLAK